MPDVPRSYVIPAWADPQQASVTDSNLTKALRWIGSVIGADSPTAQAIATLTPMDVGEGGGVIGAIQRFIKAYHGSPYSFEQFSSAHTGTGEGTQAFGPGLYFAENPQVAASYKRSRNPEPIPVPAAVRQELKALDYLGFDYPSQALNAISQDPNWKQNWDIRPGDTTTAIEQHLQQFPRGHMYEVAIKSDPNDFLDWDKPFGEQTPAVQDRVRQVMPWLDRIDPERLKQVRVSEILAQQDAQLAPVRTAALADAGIPGVKFFDRGSRRAQEGTRNYVVFDDKTIEILRKYGVLLPVAGAGAAASQSQGAQP